MFIHADMSAIILVLHVLRLTAVQLVDVMARIPDDAKDTITLVLHVPPIIPIGNGGLDLGKNQGI